VDQLTPVGHLDGLPVHLLTERQIFSHITRAIEDRADLSVAYVNAHVLNLVQDLPPLRRALEATDICYCDGMGPVWAFRAAGHTVPGRHPGRLIIPQLMKRAAKNGWRIGWLGGKPGVVDLALEKLKDPCGTFPVVWTDHGFHAPADHARQVTEINAAAPDILLVGMGSPKQERWMHRYRAALSVPVVWCVGATADTLSGTRPVGPSHLLNRAEWLARLWVEPKRLKRRYLLGNPRFAVRMMGQVLRNRTKEVTLRCSRMAISVGFLGER
jgi:N-acetylglucosaminyldiphosphoundecaprenol N-acetyl-beta-D-mannosaminyltransferase